MTTTTLARYLGRPVSILLTAAPFKNWSYQRSVENDLEEPLIDYVFALNGVDVVCDQDDKIRTIFLYADETRHFEESLEDVPWSANQPEVVARLGVPAQSGSKHKHPTLGEYGAWDRFGRPGYYIHIEYRVNGDRIKKVTVMREDVAP